MMLTTILRQVDQWFCRMLARIPERLIQYGMAVILIGWVAFQLSLFDWYYNKVQWLLETSLYTVYLLAYIRRPRAKHRAVHMSEVVLPILGASIPFLFLLTPVTIPPEYFATSLWILTVAVLLVVLSALSLGDSFAITVEVRGLKQRGMYKLVRHPMYASQMFSALVMVFLLRFSWLNVLLLFLFVVVQVTRARMEEQKLLSAYPKEYEEYKKNTKMFIPFLI